MCIERIKATRCHKHKKIELKKLLIRQDKNPQPSCLILMEVSISFSLYFSGISITKIQGAAPERKYFPSKPDTDQTLLPMPGALNPQIAMPQQQQQQQQSPMTNGGGFGYSAMAGLPSGLNGPNVIVVDTSTLKTR